MTVCTKDVTKGLLPGSCDETTEPADGALDVALPNVAIVSSWGARVAFDETMLGSFDKEPNHER